VVNEYLQAADYEAARANNYRLLGFEPWSEPAHRQQMLVLARMGERSAALAQFEACRNILAAEFGVEPLAETIALYEQIRAGEIGGPSGAGRREGVVVKDTGQGARNDPQGVPHPIFANKHDLPQRIKLFGRQ
jgi:DNA-binding SARP family transcriptional activator